MAGSASESLHYLEALDPSRQGVVDGTRVGAKAIGLRAGVALKLRGLLSHKIILSDSYVIGHLGLQELASGSCGDPEAFLQFLQHRTILGLRAKVEGAPCSSLLPVLESWLKQGTYLTNVPAELREEIIRRGRRSGGDSPVTIEELSEHSAGKRFVRAIALLDGAYASRETRRTLTLAGRLTERLSELRPPDMDRSTGQVWSELQRRLPFDPSTNPDRSQYYIEIENVVSDLCASATDEARAKELIDHAYNSNFWTQKEGSGLAVTPVLSPRQVGPEGRVPAWRFEPSTSPLAPIEVCADLGTEVPNLGDVRFDDLVAWDPPRGFDPRRIVASGENLASAWHSHVSHLLGSFATQVRLRRSSTPLQKVRVKAETVVVPISAAALDAVSFASLMAHEPGLTAAFALPGGVLTAVSLLGVPTALRKPLDKRIMGLEPILQQVELLPSAPAPAHLTGVGSLMTRRSSTGLNDEMIPAQGFD